MLINIISRHNDAGLSVDIKILTDILSENGWKVHFSDYKSMKRFSIGMKNHYDLNIFLQWANPTWMKLAKKNILIPNPEWFKKKWIKVITKFDAVFCKTRVAEEIFKKKNKNTVYTSFTSLDYYLPEIPKDKSKWLHVAGKSKLKGTEAIIKTWLKNPSFPHLTIIQRNTENSGKLAENLTCIDRLLDKEELKILMNQCAVHLCTSATEGFGHYIDEALSCGSLVITTDGPPMNELVNLERGFLVKPVSKYKLKLATAYDINHSEIERTINNVLEADNYKQIMNNSRNFYLKNKEFFINELTSQIMSIMC